MRLGIKVFSAIFVLVLLAMGCDKGSSSGGKQAAVTSSAGVQVTKGPNNEQTVCPLTGKPINKQFFAEQNGKRIYGSDQQSATYINQSFSHIAEMMEKNGIVLEKVGNGK
jgi:hypothetical protein